LDLETTTEPLVNISVGYGGGGLGDMEKVDLRKRVR